MKKLQNWLKKKHNRVFLFFTTIILILFFTIPLPYEVLLPGGVQEIESIIEIEDEYVSEGKFYSSYVTVITKPSPFIYLYSKAFNKAEIVPLSQSDRQLSVEEINQFSRISKLYSINTSIIAAYKSAGKEIIVEQDSLIIAYRHPDYHVFDVVKLGDIIIEFNEQPIVTGTEIATYINGVNDCDQTVSLTVIRNEETLQLDSPLTEVKEGVCGLGIATYMNYEIIESTPSFEVKNDQGYGSSAGLMQALMIYDKLTEEDLTDGKKVAGTGGIDVNGNVTLIGGIRQKVMGAIQDDIEIYFAPDLDVGDGTNLYQIALDVRDELKSDIIIIPVKTLDDAINYLRNIEHV